MIDIQGKKNSLDLKYYSFNLMISSISNLPLSLYLFSLSLFLSMHIDLSPSLPVNSIPHSYSLKQHLPKQCCHSRHEYMD